MNLKEILLAQYDSFPFHRHPFWMAVKERRLSLSEVLAGEAQHYLRTKAGRELRRQAAQFARASSPILFEAIVETYVEECTDSKDSPSHLALIKRLLFEGGYTEAMLEQLANTPGNIAAIALYRDIAERGVAHHLVGAGTVEYFYADLSSDIYNVYTSHYGMSEYQAETYRIHGPMDKIHADRAFSVLPEIEKDYDPKDLIAAVRDAFVATSLHYDGMYQAATGQVQYWNGRD